MTTLRSISIAERDAIIAESLAKHRRNIDVAIKDAKATIAGEERLRARVFWIAVFVLLASAAVIAGALLGAAS